MRLPAGSAGIPARQSVRPHASNFSLQFRLELQRVFALSRPKAGKMPALPAMGARSLLRRYKTLQVVRQIIHHLIVRVFVQVRVVGADLRRLERDVNDAEVETLVPVTQIL